MRASSALLLACCAIILLSHGAVTAQNTATPNFAYGPPKGWVYKPDAETLEILKQKAIKEAAAQNPSQQQQQTAAAGVAAGPLANQGSDQTAAAASADGKRVARRNNAQVTAQPMYLQARGSVGGGGRRLFM